MHNHYEPLGNVFPLLRWLFELVILLAGSLENADVAVAVMGIL